MRVTGLLSPFVGSKADTSKYPVYDYGYYDCVIEPFVGSGHFTTGMFWRTPISKAFVADSDPAIREVWECWVSAELRADVEESIDFWSERILFKNPVHAYQELKKIFEGEQYDCDGTPYDIVDRVSASILLRKLVFGGVLRCNTEGRLNVALSQDKLKAFESWRFEWLPFLDRYQIYIQNNWQHCLSRFELDSTARNAIAFVDPPYWLPKGSRPGRRGTGAMTPAYPTHGDPSGDELFRDCVDCVDRLLGNPKVRRVVVTNYWSDQLHTALEDLADRHGVDTWAFTNLGSLQTMNKTQRARKDAPTEGFWEFGGKIMGGRYHQTNLLETAS